MNQETMQRRPQARNDGLVIQELPDEVLVYDVDRHQAHCLNQTAALVWKQCDGQTSVGEMVRLLHRELKTPVDEAVVWLALDQLGKAGLLRERVNRSPGTARLSRRALMRKMGWAAAVALPVVTSLVAPTPSQASSGKAEGAPCTSSVECLSGLCVNGKCV